MASIRRIRENWQSGGATDLNRLLHEFSHRRASDDRDKIYGLLSLAEPGHGVVPDYNVDVSETFRRTACALIQATHSLDVWTGDQRRKNSKDLPSWVPDWSAIPNLSDTRRLETLSVYNACRNWSFRIVEDEEQYWACVRVSLEELRNWLEKPGQTRKLPTVLREPIVHCCDALGIRLNVMDKVGKFNHGFRELIQNVVSELVKLPLLCAPSATELIVPHSKLFNRTYGGADHSRSTRSSFSRPKARTKVRCPCLSM